MTFSLLVLLGLTAYGLIACRPDAK